MGYLVALVEGLREWSGPPQVRNGKNLILVIKVDGYFPYWFIWFTLALDKPTTF